LIKELLLSVYKISSSYQRPSHLSLHSSDHLISVLIN